MSRGPIRAAAPGRRRPHQQIEGKRIERRPVEDARVPLSPHGRSPSSLGGFVLLLLVMGDVELAGFAGMVRGMEMVPMRHMRMVRSRVVIFIFVVFGGLAM